MIDHLYPLILFGLYTVVVLCIGVFVGACLTYRRVRGKSPESLALDALGEARKILGKGSPNGPDPAKMPEQL